MVKFFTLIFCFYLTALVLTPCSDKDECHASDTEKSAFVSSEHQSHDSETENCTPFCVCACCGQTYDSEYTLNILCDVLLQAEVIKNQERVPFVKEVYFSIWQPPKIS